MIRNHFNRFLRAEASEHENAGGGAAAAATENAGAAAQAGEAGAKAEDKPPGGESRKPTLLEQVAASVQSKGSLIAERNDLQSRLTVLEGENAALKTQLGAATAELTALRDERQQISQALEKANSEKKSTDEAAARIVAEHGFQAEKLPPVEKDAETAESLAAKAEATTDPKEKFRLAKAARERESAAG